MKRFALVAALLALAAPRAVFAQVDRATVSGLVKDSGGAVVPGASVTVTNLATNVASQQTTTETGSYLVVNLIPGQYRIDVELSGFKKRSQTVTLEVGQRARVDMSLEVGNFAETVDVAGASPILKTSEAALGSVIPEIQVANLPLAIRNWDDLLALVPGRAGRPLHRAGWRHVVRPHRRHQRARRSRASEQLPARRRGQQQHLRERPGADDAGVASVGGRDSGVQGRDEPLLGRVRAVAGRRDQRLDQVGHQRLRRHRLRVLPQRVPGLHRLLLQARGRRKARERSEPVRRQPRRADHQGQRVLLRRLRGHAHHARRDPAHASADRRRARRHLHLAGPRSGDRPALRQQPDPSRPHRSVRRGDHGARAAAEPAGREQLLPRRRISSTTPTACLAASDWQPERQATASSAATSTRTARARFPARSAASIDGTGTSAFGDQTIKTNAHGRRLDSHPQLGDGQRVPLLLVAVDVGRACTRRSGWRRPQRRRSPDRLPIPIVAGGLPGHHRSTATSAARVSAASDRPTSCRSSSTPTSSSSSTRCPGCSGNHAFKFGGDIIAPMAEPVPRRAGHARRDAVPQHASPATRWPTTCSATSPTCSSPTCGSSSSGTGPRCSSRRTTGRSIRSCR